MRSVQVLEELGMAVVVCGERQVRLFDVDTGQCLGGPVVSPDGSWANSLLPVPAGPAGAAPGPAAAAAPPATAAPPPAAAPGSRSSPASSSSGSSSGGGGGSGMSGGPVLLEVRGDQVSIVSLPAPGPEEPPAGRPGRPAPQGAPHGRRRVNHFYSWDLVCALIPGIATACVQQPRLAKEMYLQATPSQRANPLAKWSLTDTALPIGFLAAFRQDPFGALGGSTDNAWGAGGGGEVKTRGGTRGRPSQSSV